ncbi:MAG: TQO small subunit DoxD [Acidobacteriaceae bacterium]
MDAIESRADGPQGGASGICHALDVHHARSAIVWLRIISSLAWLDSALIGKDAKLSASFLSGAGLVQSITEKFMHTAVTSGVADLLQNFVLPHAQVFAVLIAFTDLAIGVSLALGLFTRVGGALAILRATTNILVAGGAGADTVGFNTMLIAAGAIAIVTAAGRRYGIDRILISRWPASRFLRVIA